MSLLVFTGASQFAFIGVLAAGGGPFAAIVPAAILAMRNGLYGISLAPLLRGPLPRRLALSHLVIDETTAMARAQADPPTARRRVRGHRTRHLRLLERGRRDRRRLGRRARRSTAARPRRDASGRFLALLAPQLRQPRARPVAIAGGLIALVLVPLARPGCRSSPRAAVALVLCRARHREPA